MKLSHITRDMAFEIANELKVTVAPPAYDREGPVEISIRRIGGAMGVVIWETDIGLRISLYGASSYRLAELKCIAIQIRYAISLVEGVDDE